MDANLDRPALWLRLAKLAAVAAGYGAAYLAIVLGCLGVARLLGLI